MGMPTHALNCEEPGQGGRDNLPDLGILSCALTLSVKQEGIGICSYVVPISGAPRSR